MSIQHQINRASDLFMYCGCAELISESMSSIMIWTYFVYSVNVLIHMINSKKLKIFPYMIAILTGLGTVPSAGGACAACAVFFQDKTPPEFIRRVSTTCWIINQGSRIDAIQWAAIVIVNNWR